MQQQSNTYIIVFSAIITIILGGLLSLANQGLKPKQQKAVELDTKRQILSAVMNVESLKGNDILSTYDKTISGIVVDINGNVVEKNEKGEPIVADKVDIAANYKKTPDNRLYPVFKFHKEGNPENVEAYILAVYGHGLWGPIWGYIALDTDLNTIKGAVFDHETETPGLGARITTQEVEERFTGKKIFDDKGDLESVAMLKGEHHTAKDLDAHHVDGMSGATLTGKGLNSMLASYFKYYEGFIGKTAKSQNKVASL